MDVAARPALDIAARIVDGAALFAARAGRRRHAACSIEGDAMKVSVDEAAVPRAPDVCDLRARGVRQ